MQAWHLSSLWWTLPGISRSSSIPQARGTHYLLQVRAYLLSEAVSKRSWACYEGISALGFQTVIFKQDIEEKLIASAESGFQDEQCHLCTLLLKNLGLLSFSAGPKGQWKNESKFSRRLTSPVHDVRGHWGSCFGALITSTTAHTLTTHCFSPQIGHTAKTLLITNQQLSLQVILQDSQHLLPSVPAGHRVAGMGAWELPAASPGAAPCSTLLSPAETWELSPAPPC